MQPYSKWKVAISFGFFALFAGMAFPQGAGPDSASSPKNVFIQGADHFDRMTAMGRLAHTVANARAQQPSGGNRRSFQAVLDSSNKPDDCSGGDEDCSNGGFSEGPGFTQSEMAIAIDPTGQHIVVGFNDFRGFNISPQSLSGYAYSDDGGLTFTDGQQLPVISNGHISTTALPQIFGDADVKYVPGGAGCQFIYSSIMVKGFLGTAPNFTGTAGTMSIHRSTDCGHTWTGPFEVTPATNPNGLLSGGNAFDSADKEFIDVDPETGRVMMSWSNFTSSTIIPGGVEISTIFSDNIMTGNPPTWSARKVLNPGSVTFDTGSQPRFAGNGSNNLYVAWATESFTTGLSNEQVATSTDNGVTFGAAVTLNGSDYFPPDQILGDDRIHSFPSMAVDVSAGVNKNNVYVVYANNNNFDGADIVFQRSTNGGVSFSPGILLNSRPGSDRSQWFPAITVDSTTGRIHVMYDDQGAAASGDGMQMTWMYSDDGGITWSKPAALTRPFHAGYGNDTSQPNLGDYNMVVATNGTFYGAFPMVPNVVSFNDGQPNSQIGFPTFLGNTIPGGNAPAPGFAKMITAKAALDLGAVTFTESGADGFIDAGDQANFTFPLRNYVTNSAIGPTTTYSGVSATLSTTTPGVTVTQATSAYANVAPGGTQSNSAPFVVNVATSFVPGTKIDFSLAVATGQGSAVLLFTQNTGTPIFTTVFSENFNSSTPGTLPVGWATIHAGGRNTVPWTTNSSFCSTSSNALYHANANDGVGGTGNPTRFERVATPNIAIPANSQYVTLDFDICYDTEDDPNFNILAYDGFDLRITDFTAGHLARANFAEALAESIQTGTFLHYPKHNPRSSSTAYFQDISLWAGFSNGFQHVSMRFNGMAGDTVQLRPDFTQDGNGTCADVRPGHACGVMLDNIVMRSVTSCPFIAITPATIVVGSLGSPYSVQFGQTGVVGSVTFSEAGALPDGVTFTSAGLLSGVSRQTGAFPITVNVVDSNGCKGTANYTLVIQGPITGFALNSPPLRNDFGGFAGMQLRVGANPLSVFAVGRVCVAGNSQTHTVKLVSESSKADIPGGSAQVNMLNCLPGQFVHANLTSPITLAPATTYYLVSQEFQNGDKFYEHGSLTFKADASVISSVYFNGVNWIAIDGPNTSYVPPDLGYTTLPAPTTQAFVLDYNQNNQALRNNFTGFVGMNLKVGASALQVTSVGRVCVAGNSQSHLVKFVDAATGGDLLGGSAAVSMSGCTASQFAYTDLSAPLTLQPNTSYYLMSQEASGGDQWFDQGTLRTRTDATVNGAVFSNAGGYAQQPGLNNSYVPANFLYQPLP